MVCSAPDHEDPRCETVLTELKSRVGARPFALWFEGKVRLEIAGEQLLIAVGSPFLLNCINKQFRRELAEVAQLVLGNSATPTLTVDATLALTVPMERENRTTAALRLPAAPSGDLTRLELDAPPAPSRPAVVTSGGRQRRLADLSDFIPTPLAEFALTASRHVAAAPGTQFNPLFLYGSVGTGKTHLLEGICRQLRRTHPQLQVTLLTAEAFANYFTQALTERTLPSFRHKFRGVDVLLVDDVDFFESKRVFQEEFLHTLCDLADHGRQVVVTADRHPRLLTKLGDDLVSRFQSGLICRLETPDLDTRRQIVIRKAQRLEGEFAPEALQFVAERFTGSVRELEGALNCLQTFYGMTQKRITAATARQVLADLERDCLRVVRLADIERVVCQVFGLKPKDLKSDSRVRTLAQPRMLAMFLARKHTQSAYSEIGQHFGGRNHSTVMSAERKVQKWLEDNVTVRVASQSWTFQEIVANLEQQLLAG
ncbi:MAG: chromosomal replication initiator protein DnaA [Planctomycetaceae bacterium]|nr:chromosomal replication initiator protein DnaA [Planctomycetaceae bacterium]